MPVLYSFDWPRVHTGLSMGEWSVEYTTAHPYVKNSSSKASELTSGTAHLKPQRPRSWGHEENDYDRENADN
jgi:hypothetical protein